jgi:serine/threonine protein kinase
MVRKNMVNHVLAERRVLSLAKTPFVVKLYFAFQSRQCLYLVMEFVVGGDIGSLIKSLGPFEESMALFYTGECSMALEVLHQNGIVHRFAIFLFN